MMTSYLEALEGAERARLKELRDLRAEVLVREGEVAAMGMLLAEARAERDKMRSAITDALAAMKNPDRTAVECLCDAHAVLSRALAD